MLPCLLKLLVQTRVNPLAVDIQEGVPDGKDNDEDNPNPEWVVTAGACLVIGIC